MGAATNGVAMSLPRLLLIDDEPEVARFVAHAAQACGYDAQITLSSSSFRAAFDEAVPDAVALDLAMPAGDGVELLRFLAERKFAAPVVIISGFDRRVLESAFRLGEALGLNMVGPLTKPMRLHELEEVLQGLGRPVAR